MTLEAKQQCSTCGVSLDANSRFCAKCGAPIKTNAVDVMNGANQEAIGCALNSIPEFAIGLVKRHDLFFTHRRMVVIDLGRDQAVGRAAGGLIGKAIAKRSENKEREKRASLSLDQLIALNPKDNYAVKYDDVQSMKLTGPNLIVKGTLEIKSIQQEKTKSFGLSKDEYKTLKAYLQTVPVLGSKLQVK